MRLFGWVQDKLHGKQGNKKPNTASHSTHHAKPEPREEFSDWPHGLLAIGTFGNNNLKENTDHRSQDIQEEPCSSDEILENFTPEEVGKLHKELTKLLTKKPDIEKEIAALPLDRFLNCPSSLEVDRRTSNVLCSDSDDHKDEDIEKTISVILGRCKEICADSNKKAIGKKSISFLLKKMFVCRSGFAPAPSLRDTLQESRMEKLLRLILNKKIINPQNSSRATSMKKYLEDTRQNPTKKGDNIEEDTKEKINDGCKWVKTDSEYIVLEI